jgi:hypothetical protein
MSDKKTFNKVALHDSYTAASIVSTSGNITTIAGLPPIVAPQMSVKSVTAVAGANEVTQVLNITLAATVTADTNYSLRFKFADERYQNEAAEPQLLRAQTPNALSGSAATDKHNIYARLAYQFNASQRFKRRAVAYAVFTLTYTGQTANFTVGSTVVGGTSGARGIILSQADGGATGTLTLATIPGYSSSFQAEALTEILASGAAGTGDGTAAVLTLGVKLQINDRAGYYPINGFDGGALIVYPNEGFVRSDIVVGTAAVYSKFTGANLLEMRPVKQYSSENLNSGYIDHANLNNQPTSGNLYNLVIIEVEENLSTTAINEAGGLSGAVTRTYGLYLNNGDGDYAATLAAIQALA